MVEFLLVTNNPQVAKKYPELDVRYLKGPVLAVLLRVRDLIHRGHRLLTHPLSGSLKPGRIPYKTVFLSRHRETGVDLDSLRQIENSIATYYKTLPQVPPSWQPRVLDDYAIIDLSHVEAALESLLT